MKKIKEFFNKIFSYIGNFFRFLGDKIKLGLQKLGETPFVRKVLDILGYSLSAVNEFYPTSMNINGIYDISIILYNIIQRGLVL